MINWLPFGALFATLIVFGTALSVSSAHWLGAWIGLEINLIGFLPLLIHRGSLRETESGVKYLIIQALGSGLLLTGSLMAYISTGAFNITEIFMLRRIKYLAIIGLLLKLGAAPLHFWLPRTMASIGWINCMLLATWQKIAPIILLLSTANQEIKIILLCAVLGALIGGVGGLNQTHIRALLAYSSIVHIAWIISAIIFNYYRTILYFSIYLISNLLLFTFLASNNLRQNQLFSTTTFIAYKNSWMLILLMLSLGGIPPLLGFVGKWIVITRISNNNIILMLFLIAGSILRLFYYLSLAFSFNLRGSGTIQSTYLLINKPDKTNILTYVLTTVILFGGILPLMLI